MQHPEFKNQVPVMDFTLIFPQELAEMIFSYLTAADLFRVACCNKIWRELSNSDMLWQPLCAAQNWLHFNTDGQLFTRSQYSCSSMVYSGADMSKVPALTHTCLWKEVYSRATHLQQNWARGRYTVFPLLQGHKKRVTCLDCDGQYVVSGSEDNSARVWDLFTAHCLHVLDGHTDAVTCAVMKNDYVLTGCADNHIRIFQVQTGVLLQSLMGHSDSIEHLCFDGHRILSASADRTLRVWTLEPDCCKHVLTGHEDDIQFLTMQDALAVSTSWDRCIRMWDLETGKCIKSLSSQDQVVYCCQFDSRFLVFGGSEGLVIIIETDKEEMNGMRRCEGHSSDVYCLVFNEKIICSGSSDSTIKVWDFTGKCLFTLHEHIGVVRCLHLHGNRLVSGGDIKKIAVWDVQAGVLLHVVHRNPTLLYKWWVNDAKIITASPDSPGTLTILSYW